MLVKQNEIPFTVVGEFFSETIPEYSETWSLGNETPLETEMRLFSACVRWAFNRLQEGVSREAIKKQGQALFGLNSRYVDYARLQAQGILESQKTLLARRIEETETKLSRARRKLSWAEKKLRRAEKKGVAVEERRRLAIAVQGRRYRVSALEKKLRELKMHEQNGTVPKVIFGGRKLWRKVSRKKVPREAWRAARRNVLYARGDRTKGGNPNLKITDDGMDFRLSVTLSHRSEQVGTDRLDRPKMTRAPRVEGRLWVSGKHRELLRRVLTEKIPYTVELKRGPDGRYRAHITFSLSAPMPTTETLRGFLGIDTNPDGLAVANVGRDGNPEPWPEELAVPFPKNLGKYDGEFQILLKPHGFFYLRVPELAHARGNRRTYLIGTLGRVIVDMAKALGKPIALENLAFAQGRMDTDRTFNRMASNFPHEKVLEAIFRRAQKEGVLVRFVRPEFTSTIGWYKYRKRFGVTVHEAAALVIGRRALGFREQIPQSLRRAIVERLKGSSAPVEGTRMTRKAGSGHARKVDLLKLEEQLERHNGLALWQQTSFASVWRTLRRLAFAFR